jgi:diaminohydroxyphosphoribosylaminopyrimidine deaminase/5-amino-6-(5-phosphoribosylamino)uracil reductase
MPAVISVVEKINEPRYPSFKGIMAAKKKTIETRDLATVGASAQSPWSQVVDSALRPPRAAGIKVVEGVLKEEAALSNRAWLMKIKKNRPFFTWKVAATLDGKVAAADGTSKWITNETSRADVQVLRRQADAILVGTNTVIADDPHLIPRGTFAGYGANPIRVVCGEQALPADAQVFDDAAQTVVVKSKDLDVLVEKLNELGVNHVFVEAGPTLGSAMLDGCLLDELIMYQAPTLLGTGKHFFAFDYPTTITDQMRMDHLSTQVLDGDVKSVYRIRNGE